MLRRASSGGSAYLRRQNAAFVQMFGQNVVTMMSEVTAANAEGSRRCGGFKPLDPSLRRIIGR